MRKITYACALLLLLAGCNKDKMAVEPLGRSSASNDTACSSSADVYATILQFSAMRVRSAMSESTGAPTYEAVSSTLPYSEGDSIKLVLARPICAGSFAPRPARIYIDNAAGTTPCTTLAKTLPNFNGQDYNVRFVIPSVTRSRNATDAKQYRVYLIIDSLPTDTGANQQSATNTTFHIRNITGPGCLAAD